MKPIDNNAWYGDFPSCRGDSRKITSMRPRPMEPRNDLVSRSDRLLHNPANVGKSRPHHPNHVFEAFPALLLPRQRIQFDEIFFDEFICDFEPALVDHFLYESLESGNVLSFRQDANLRDSSSA